MTVAYSSLQHLYRGTKNGASSIFGLFPFLAENPIHSHSLVGKRIEILIPYSTAHSEPLLSGQKSKKLNDTLSLRERVRIVVDVDSHADQALLQFANIYYRYY